MSENRINISQDNLSNPIKVQPGQHPVELVQRNSDDALRVRLNGGRWTAIATASVIGLWILMAIRGELHTANELKRRELDIKIVQTELARRQYTLDSARFAMQQRGR